jgi:hypothetical protein
LQVGGGLSSGLGIRETAIKEAFEEANVPQDIAMKMKSVGIVTFFFKSSRGIKPQTEFVFDLELPTSFVPKNNDGEVDGFELVPIDKVAEKISSYEFKTTSCSIAIDFLIRHGVVNAENEPNLPQLVENLHIPIHHLYEDDDEK